MPTDRAGRGIPVRGPDDPACCGTPPELPGITADRSPACGARESPMTRPLMRQTPSRTPVRGPGLVGGLHEGNPSPSNRPKRRSYSPWRTERKLVPCFASIGKERRQLPAAAPFGGQISSISARSSSCSRSSSIAASGGASTCGKERKIALSPRWSSPSCLPVKNSGSGVHFSLLTPSGDAHSWR